MTNDEIDSIFSNFPIRNIHYQQNERSQRKEQLQVAGPGLVRQYTRDVSYAWKGHHNHGWNRWDRV